MTIKRCDFVRAINPKLGLPPGSVWHVRCAAGGLKLEPVNGSAKRADPLSWQGMRFSPDDFEKVTNTRDGWASAQLESNWMTSNDLNVNEFLDQPTAPSVPAADVDKAEERLAYAANAAKEYQALLQNARDLEATRRQALRLAKAAQAKADREAAAKAKVVEAKRQLDARLHADRCLADATLELIGEVSRLNSGGPEKEAPAAVAMHAAQLQPLAKSYGYRIVKPSLIAIVVKL